MAMKMVSPEQAAVRQRFRGPNWKPEDDVTRPPGYEYFGPITGNLGSDVTDVQMVNRTIGRHSHEVDEFQIMLGVPGALFEGKPVPSIMIHYSDAFALYGPLTGADESFHLLQLRAEPIDHSVGGAWGDYRLPDDRHLMPYVSERHEEAVVPELSTVQPTAPGELRSEALIDADDGVGTWLMTAGPGAGIPIASPAGSSGQFVYVVDGAITYDGELFGQGSIGWQPPEDEHVQLFAGADGCRVVLMRTPFPPTKVSRANMSAQVPTV